MIRLSTFVRKYVYLSILSVGTLHISELKAGDRLNALIRGIGQGFVNIASELYYWRTPDTTMPISTEELGPVSFIPVVFNRNLPTRDTEKNVVRRIIAEGDGGRICVRGQYYRVQRGIAPGLFAGNKQITLYTPSCGDRGRVGYCLYTALKAGTIQGPAVTFAPSTGTRRRFNFCQEQDLQCVELMHEALRKKKQNVRIVFHGVCAGGTLFLRYLAERCAGSDREDRVRSIAAVIVETPAVTVSRSVAVIPGTGWLSHLLVRASCPNYNPHQLTVLQATRFPASVPVLIGSLPHDRVSKRSDIQLMVEHLRNFSPRLVHHFLSCGRERIYDMRSPSVRHGRLGRADDFQLQVKMFRTLTIHYALPQ